MLNRVFATNKLIKNILSVVLATSICVPAWASVAVSPMRVEVNANKARNNYLTTALEVKGDSQVPMRFKAYAGYFEIDEKGEAVMIDNSDSKYDLSKKLRFVPSEFTVAANKTQKLRVNVANVKSLPDGESRAMLYIEDINPKEFNIPTGQAGIGAQLIVKTRLGIPIYVDYGKFTKIGLVENYDAIQQKDGLHTSIKISSTGNSKIRYTKHIQIAQGKKLVYEQELKGGVIASGKSIIDKDVINLKNVPTGEYTTKMIVTYLDQDEKRKNLKEEKMVKIQSEM